MAKDVRRWHGTDCVQPDVCVGNDLVPFCQACGISAFAVLQTLTTGESSSVPQVPADEAPGQHNLFWPPSVRYTTADHVTQSSHENKNTESRTESIDGEVVCSAADSIYTEHLSSGQIHLVVLAPSPRDQKGYPIYVSLELHDDIRCPEYDAVSYTWGGEDNDYTRSSPVFVGDYWDILAQPKNCVSMLKYLRPKRGLRTIWIDAVCINQNDSRERTVQVGKMENIYARCSQVWLWLGDDIVCEDLQAPPERHWLHEISSKDIQPRYPTTASCETSADEPTMLVTISMLLKRRYFSRVWVIQELAVAPRVVIPIGDVLLLADHVTQQKLQALTTEDGGWKWDETQAPWLYSMALGPLDRSELHEVLRFTSNSKATDIRDKLFGVLGLATSTWNTAGQRVPMWPEYSISKLHMAIGLVAQLMLNSGQTSLFYASRGLADPLGYQGGQDRTFVLQDHGNNRDFLRNGRTMVQIT
ncbi:hypothetical protein CMUS01_16648 [Colletotrichum musicola]|uniref:Heterokaryon incompatibility domain-containing protein n=1 Tax=Colletotrichum musicola TaxID=2175873 RepID=A0A8H6MI20_9PEZI|nr:hypothetical protein CMUS01_16648 [Colletotrichum musicola]